MPDPAAHIGLVLAAGSAGQALALALATAKKAGARPLRPLAPAARGAIRPRAASSR
jgi:hypothetical protein